MPSVLHENWKYISGALLIHALLAVLFVGLNFGSRQAVVPQLAIHAVMVDRNTLNRLAKQAPPAADLQRKQAEDAAKQQELQRQRDEAEKAAQEQQKQQQEQQQKLKEQQRQDQLRLDAEAKQRAMAEQQRAQEAEKQMALQRQAAEAKAREQQRLADIQQKQRELEQKRQADADAKSQATREAELKQQLEMEEGRAQAVNAGLLNQYVALLNQRVERNWTKPPSAKAGLECEVKVTQAAGGTVLSVAVGRCNGDQAVRASIEAAVYKSSPLPAPPDPRLFDRNLTFIFKPVE